MQCRYAPKPQYKQEVKLTVPNHEGRVRTSRADPVAVNHVKCSNRNHQEQHVHQYKAPIMADRGQTTMALWSFRDNKQHATIPTR